MTENRRTFMKKVASLGAALGVMKVATVAETAQQEELKDPNHKWKAGNRILVSGPAAAPNHECRMPVWMSQGGRDFQCSKCGRVATRVFCPEAGWRSGRFVWKDNGEAEISVGSKYEIEGGRFW